MTLRRQILAELVWRGTITPNQADELLVPLEEHDGNSVDYLARRGIAKDEVLSAAATAAGVPLAPPNLVVSPRGTSLDVAQCLAAGGIPIAQRGNLPCVAWADPDRASAGRDALPSHISMLTSSSLWVEGRRTLVGELGFATSAPPTIYGVTHSSESSGSGLLADDLEEEAGGFEAEATVTDAARLLPSPHAGVVEDPADFASAELIDDEVTDSASLEAVDANGTEESEVTSRNSVSVAVTSIEEDEEIQSFEEADTTVAPTGGTESYSNPSASGDQFSPTVVTGENPLEYDDDARVDHTELEQEPSLTASAPPMSAEGPELGQEVADIRPVAPRPAVAPRDAFARSARIDDDAMPMPPSTLILSEPPSSLEDEADGFDAPSDEGPGVGPDFVHEPAPGEVRRQQDSLGGLIGQVRAWGEEMVARGEGMVARRERAPEPEAPSAEGPVVRKWAVNPDELTAGPGTQGDDSPSDFERES